MLFFCFRRRLLQERKGESREYEGQPTKFSLGLRLAAVTKFTTGGRVVLVAFRHLPVSYKKAGFGAILQVRDHFPAY